MAMLFWGFWVVGGFSAAVLGEVVRAENPRIARAGRIAFALLLGVDLLLAAVVFSVGQDAATSHMTRGLWWFTVALAGVPLALVSGLAVLRGYRGHRFPLVVATLTTAALYLAFPLGFTPRDETKLNRLGRFEHDHHVLGVAILLIPTLILLASELRWKHEAAPVPSQPVRTSTSLSRVRRRNLVGAAILLVALVGLAGTDGFGIVLWFGVAFAGTALLLWRWHRSQMRSVLRDLRPPEKP